ncbi:MULTISPECIES: hypothetical protein [Staphylococcus]|uniref:hypothetical protein n=1 Tax=Staphylococcus TaxID=1279 RepID=UPI00143CC55B|nr:MULTISPECIES: hypothetical protein [Staphylococcus]GGG97928.1 hypothetical protein GCM10007342_22090 [Staphylococcus pragensis]
MIIRAIKEFIKGAKKGVNEAKENPEKFEYGVSKEEARRRKFREDRNNQKDNN